MHKRPDPGREAEAVTERLLRILYIAEMWQDIREDREV